MRIKRRGAPVDYRLCNQTVTLYHWAGTGICKGPGRQLYQTIVLSLKNLEAS